MKPTAAGFLSGVGSMLIGAKLAGFKVLYNIEDRKSMLPESFEMNFDGAKFYRSIEEAPKDKIDLLMGHPPCGNFSSMTNSTKKSIKDFAGRRKDPGKIPNFVEAVKIIKPRYFVMENLIKSTQAFPFSEYQRNLANDYDLSINEIHNWDYGNSQKFKKRLFVIGSLKDEGYKFIPITTPKDGKTVRECIGDLPLSGDIPEINHEHVDPDEMAPFYWGVNDDGSVKHKTYREIRKIMLDMPPGKAPTYINRDGVEKFKIGMRRMYLDKHAFTQTGGSKGRSTPKIHPITGYPITVREKLRIQGAPDWFKITGDPTEQNIQSGKFIAVEFCEYVAKQIYNHITKES